ncbi:hypothetical protein Agabi119p4_7669 [Agaricus bisporus var. burnettii]|uniref:Uncharacterized protein n=1 Tax=Agaricus bisporus var. burnettii TaxID=192524 RepID=A0A8H7EZ95_AGABI|nr:hypothetical protein Agabi119p4_7669 [Agaricus bisporus var. burnettii]
MQLFFIIILIYGSYKYQDLVEMICMTHAYTFYIITVSFYLDNWRHWSVGKVIIDSTRQARWYSHNKPKLARRDEIVQFLIWFNLGEQICIAIFLLYLQLNGQTSRSVGLLSACGVIAGMSILGLIRLVYMYPISHAWGLDSGIDASQALEA